MSSIEISGLVRFALGCIFIVVAIIVVYVGLQDTLASRKKRLERWEVGPRNPLDFFKKKEKKKEEKK